MAIKLINTAEAAKSNGVKMLVYGRAGMGKTVLCATAPNPFIISAESGMLSLTESNLRRLEEAGKVNTRGRYNFPGVEINSVSDLMEVYNWVVGSAEAKQFETICLDSLSEIAETVLSHAKGQVKDPRQAYGELIEKMTMTVKAFRDLPGKHVYMSCKMELVKDDAIGTTKYMPSMPGSKLGQQLPYLFDEVFLLETSPKQGDQPEYRYFQTQPSFQFDAKDRSGALNAVEQPDLGVTIGKILAN